LEQEAAPSARPKEMLKTEMSRVCFCFIRSLLGRKPRPSGQGGSPAVLFLDIA
jgi:hypothetical protein